MITIIRKQLIENKAYKVFVWGMIILMIISLGLPSLVSQSSKRSSWIALVNDSPIEYDEYSRRVADYEYRMRMLRRQFGDSFMSSLNPQALALDSLIRNELVGQVARLVPIVVDEEVIHDTLSDTEFVYQELSDIVPSEIVDPTHGINTEQLQTYLKTVNITPAEFNLKVTDSIQRSLIKDLVTLASYTPSTQLKEHYINEYARKKFSVLKVSQDDCLSAAQKKKVTPQELQAFFDTQNSSSGRYYVPEKRAGIVATLHARDYGIVISDDEIERYYTEHKTQEFVDKPAQVQVRHLVVSSAEQAQKLRAELLQDPSRMAKTGSLLPLFSRNSTNEPVRERAAFLLKQDGDISDVITTSEGFEIVQRVQRIPATFTSLDQAKKTIRTTLMNAAFAQAFNSDMTQISRKTETERGAVDQYVSERKGKVVEHALAGNDNSMLMTQLFNLKKGQSTYYVEGEVGTVVMLTDSEPRHIPSLDTISRTVEQDYYKHQAHQMVQEIMAAVQKEAETTTPAELRKRYNVSLITTPSIKKGDEKLVESLRAQHLPVDDMLQIEKTGMAVAREFEGNGFIIRLDEISPTDAREFEEHKKDLLAKLEQDNAQAVGAGFVASLYRHATIKQNESLSTR